MPFNSGPERGRIPTRHRRRAADHDARTRRELAHHYLKHSAVELNETAFLLGYEDANSFFRDFHGWEGTSPGEWRTRHRQPAVALVNQ